MRASASLTRPAVTALSLLECVQWPRVPRPWAGLGAGLELGGGGAQPVQPRMGGDLHPPRPGTEAQPFRPGPPRP